MAKIRGIAQLNTHIITCGVCRSVIEYDYLDTYETESIYPGGSNNSWLKDTFLVIHCPNCKTKVTVGHISLKVKHWKPKD